MNEVKDALPPPALCDVCCSTNVEYTDNSVIYGRSFGEWPKCYFCHDCRAAVGCHPGTEIPLGRMAGRVTRTLRSRAHHEFDKLWKDGLMSRSKAYHWLSQQLGINQNQCHISWLSDDQLKDVATLAADYFRTHYEILLKRKAKRDEKTSKQPNSNRIERSDSEFIRQRERNKKRASARKRRS